MTAFHKSLSEKQLEARRKRDLKYHYAHREERNAKSRAYQRMHRDQIRKQRHEHYILNREKINARCLEYNEKHREEQREKSRIYRQNHLADARKRELAYNASHREQRINYLKGYYQRNKEKNKVACALWRIEHREYWREKCRQKRQETRRLAMIHLCGKATPVCESCDCNSFGLLQFNHLNIYWQPGKRPSSEKPDYLATRILQNKIGREEVNVLCAVCNVAHHHSKPAPELIDLSLTSTQKKVITYFESRRLLALQKICGSETPFCQRCGCNVFRLLQINHFENCWERGKRPTKEMGRPLCGKVLKQENARLLYSVLCPVCNQAEYRERDKGRMWNIVWTGISTAPSWNINWCSVQSNALRADSELT